jgi:hypothetical protein
VVGVVVHVQRENRCTERVRGVTLGPWQRGRLVGRDLGVDGGRRALGGVTPVPFANGRRIDASAPNCRPAQVQRALELTPGQWRLHERNIIE